LKKLDNVTLIAYTDHEVEGTIKSLQISASKMEFAKVKLLCWNKPENLPENIIWEYAPPINDINDFNLYMFKGIGNHVDTSHALYVQAHSWILNEDLWDDDWLQYDYIGGAWKYVDDAYIAWGSGEHVFNGNGGFSLRSRKIMRIPIDHDLPLLQEKGWFNEDGNLTCYYRELMLTLGIKYAPIEVASKFAYENPMLENDYGKMKTFGYHRNMSLW